MYVCVMLVMRGITVSDTSTIFIQAENDIDGHVSVVH